jgi:hypothetical protein
MDVLRMDEKALQYFTDGQDLCEQIDHAINDFNCCENDITENREFLRKKRRTYVGSRFFIMFALICLAWIPVIGICKLFISFPVWVLMIPTALAFAYYTRWKYIKNVLPVYENIYGKYIENEQEFMKELMEELYIDRNQYEETMHLIPSNMRHNIAMEIMKESIASGFSQNLHEAIKFYKDRYILIRKSKEDGAEELKREIEVSEKRAIKRIEMMMNLESIAESYI